ncbi:AAA family ATPase [Actinacidiphila bryophytorum]|uniref:TmrB-like protein n=1 Tax=Actinacidiphila bryophytorum TaxID=1436133 RepID=A0A9W4H2B1_9ACTN|nr:AAA family ATPase [Actinacidiphila bryophytorum]MBM9440594.1 AAA family ATPase [Actinacidiphila bryophytorum]MBN6543177.1 AAA family ATPase [Actinacidiphila bryophytorum]CAG7645255.1 TmrB-like protein [Actinacidiphila bryophytorum]
MLIWIYGAFGSGKTTLAGELRSRLPEALLFDPEAVGTLLSSIVDVPTGDFQDLRQWRRQVAALATGLVQEYARPLLVPMTLVEPAYLQEIFGSLDAAGIQFAHFFLDVPHDVLVDRIDARSLFSGDPVRSADGRAWCKARLPACLAARATLPPDTVVLDGRLPAEALAAAVLARTGLGPRPGGA